MALHAQEHTTKDLEQCEDPVVQPKPITGEIQSSEQGKKSSKVAWASL